MNAAGARSPNTTAGATPIAAGDLIDFASALLSSRGVGASSAAIVAEALVAADLDGLASHGVTMLPLYLDRITAGSVSPDCDGEIISQNGAASVLDAGNGLGQVTSKKAVDIAIRSARVHGLGAVAVRNGFHFGAAGRWAAMMAAAGCIGIVTCNTRPLMPAPGGAEPVVGNNPVAFAFPAEDGGPLIVDLALSAAAMGKIRLAAAAGEQIPDGWATDSDGAPTNDPQAAIDGMLLPAAGPKGFGVAVALDLLCGGLSSGAVGAEVNALYGDPATPYACAHFFLAVDVSAFAEADTFRAIVSRIVRSIRQSRSSPGTDAVLAPGDPAIMARREADGVCQIAKTTVASLCLAAEKSSVLVPTAFSQP